VALFYGPTVIFKPKDLTRSTNKQFNAYVNFFERETWTTIEYRDFDTFEDSVDQMYKPVGSPHHQAILANKFVTSAKVFSLGREFDGDEVAAMRTESPSPVKVYYDDEKEVLFYIGDAFSSRFFYAARAPDPTATYGYYTTFTSSATN
jgi:hypothetical protein